MMNSSFKLIVFLFIFTTQNHLEAAHYLCLKKTSSITDLKIKQDIETFFQSISQWTEVKKDGSLEVTDRPPVVRMRVNFSNPLQTQVTYGNKKRNDIQEICRIKDGFSIKVGSTILNLVKTQHGIRSQYEIPIIKKTETYYYMPKEVVEPKQTGDLVIDPASAAVFLSF